MTHRKFSSWFPLLPSQVWILAAGRFLSQIGNGFILFYAPIFFVNQVGLSATAVGIGIGSGSISGVIGRFLGGSFSDTPFWGRRRTLLLSAAVSAIADLAFVLTYNFPMFIIGNLLMGLGVGLYWPPTEAAVADLTPIHQRNEAYAVTRLADSVGLGLGVVLGGAVIALGISYRTLFMVDGISFVVFWGIVYWAIAETRQFSNHHPQVVRQGWGVALRDRSLMIFIWVNILFTTYLSQVHSTMPLYFANFTTQGEFTPAILSSLFTWHVVCAALLQLPIARWLNRFSRPRALILAIITWGIGFVIVWLTGVVQTHALIWATIALSLLAIATVAYTPSASALVVDLAPESLRGIYLSINSQCWAIGYLIGPPLGGWALDQSKAIANGFWLILSFSTGIGILILQILHQLILTQKRDSKLF